MRLPVIRGIIDRRILVNYRVDPNVLALHLPAPFRPKLVRGWGMAGICLIRLKNLRPVFMPSWAGIGSENAAHRVAVEWDERDTVRSGVFIVRRDTNSRLNSFAGGSLFPGVHHYARFIVNESREHYSVALRSDDDFSVVWVRGCPTAELPASSVFPSLNQASAFFRTASLGYSPASHSPRFEGLELRCVQWRAEPFHVDAARSSYFDDEMRFPTGSVELDSALLMTNIAHEWHGMPDLRCSESLAATTA